MIRRCWQRKAIIPGTHDWNARQREQEPSSFHRVVRGEKREDIAMHPIDAPEQEAFQVSMPNAMAIVTLERQALHEKIVRLRMLREAAEAEKNASKS